MLIESKQTRYDKEVVVVVVEVVKKKRPHNSHLQIGQVRFNFNQV